MKTGDGFTVFCVKKACEKGGEQVGVWEGFQGKSESIDSSSSQRNGRLKQCTGKEGKN